MEYVTAYLQLDNTGRYKNCLTERRGNWFANRNASKCYFCRVLHCVRYSDDMLRIVCTSEQLDGYIKLPYVKIVKIIKGVENNNGNQT